MGKSMRPFDILLFCIVFPFRVTDIIVSVIFSRRENGLSGEELQAKVEEKRKRVANER